MDVVMPQLGGPRVSRGVTSLGLRYCNEPLEELLSKKTGYEENWLLSPVPLRRVLAVWLLDR